MMYIFRYWEDDADGFILQNFKYEKEEKSSFQPIYAQCSQK